MRPAIALFCDFTCNAHLNAIIVRAMRNIDQAIARVRYFASSQGWTKSRLAKEAGLQDTTLRSFHDPEWNPTAQTLRAIEAIIPSDFDPARIADIKVPSDEPLEAAAPATNTKGAAA